MTAVRHVEGPVEGDAEDGGTAWQRIARAISAQIARGEHPAGAPLPTVLALASAHGVNRHTVRRALHALREDGLVSVEQGRGTFVTGGRFPYRLGRRVSLRGNFGAAGIEASGEVLGSEARGAGADEARDLALDPGAPVWAVTTLSRAAGVPVSSGVHVLDRARFPDFPAALEAGGASITAALRARGVPDYARLSTRLSARAATRDEAERLGLPPGTPVLAQVAVDGLPDGTPLQRVEGAFAGPRIEVVVEAG